MKTLDNIYKFKYNQWDITLIPILDTADNDYILRVEYTGNTQPGGTGVIYEEPHGIHICLDSYVPHGLRLLLEKKGHKLINGLRKNNQNEETSKRFYYNYEKKSENYNK